MTDANAISRQFIAQQTENRYRPVGVRPRRIGSTKYEYTLFGISERVWFLAAGLACVAAVLL